MEKRTHHCPNCSAPLQLAMGETEIICDYCGSRLHFVPEKEELEVVKKREEMKHRERIAARKMELEKRLRQEEAERWRQAAAKVAIKALPVVGDSAGRAIFNAALRKGRGCLGCGCLSVLLLLSALAFILYAAMSGPS